MVCSLVLQIVAAIALLTGVASFGLLLLNPYTLIGSFGLSLTGAFVLLTHNNRLRNTLYRAFPQSIRHFLFEK